MLAMASRLFRYHGKSGALFPALTVFDLMDEAWPNWMSELDCHPLLNANALFIPDLQVSEGSGWFPDHNQCSQMLKFATLSGKVRAQDASGCAGFVEALAGPANLSSDTRSL